LSFLRKGDIQKLARKLFPHHSALVLLFENAWERKFKEIVKKYDGAVTNQRLITSESTGAGNQRIQRIRRIGVERPPSAAMR
jgi:hypothetical protein